MFATNIAALIFKEFAYAASGQVRLFVHLPSLVL
jgi:hypothetical protein